MNGLGLRITLAEVRLLAQASDAIERLKADAAAFVETIAERTGVVDFLDVGALAFDVPPERALAYFREKGLRATWSYADMIGAVHDQAFTVAKMMDVDLLGQVRESLTAALADGQQFREWRATIQPALETAGWWGTRSVVDPLTGNAVQARLGTPWRLETIFRTNMQTAYAAQAWTEIEAQADLAPYLIYDAVDDLRTRDAHRRWDRTTLPVDAAWWRTHYPPNGYNCRCGVIQVSEDELRELGLRPTAPPDDGTYRWTNPRTGDVINVPNGIDPGFDRRPGLAGSTVRTVLAEKVQQLPAAPQAAAQAAIRRTFDTRNESGLWHAHSFDNAPDWLRNKVLDDPFVNVQMQSRGAWARGGQLVDMDQLPRTDARAASVWRHEFGHIMDYRIGNVYVSAQPPFKNAMLSDGKVWTDATGRSRSRKYAEQVKAAYDDAQATMVRLVRSEREPELRRRAKRAGIDYDDLLQLLAESSVILRDTGAQGATQQVGTAARIARLIEAIRMRDGEGFVRFITYKDSVDEAVAARSSTDMALYGRLVSQSWKRDGSIANLSDLIGASTINKACPGPKNGFFGHTTAYYRASTTNPGAEAFANLTALAGHPNPTWWVIVQRMAPAMAAVYEKIIRTGPP